MRKRLLFSVLALCACVPACRSLAEDPVLKGLRPVVIGTFPAAGSENIDPGLTRLKIAFSKRMTPKSYSLCMKDKDSFPKIEGEPKFSPDGKSCLVAVSLEPGKTYVIWINSANNANFKDTDGHPAVPYLFAFRTADAKFVEDKKKAAETAEAWLKFIDDKNYAKSWETAAEFFKKRVSKEVWDGQLANIRGGLGKLVSRKLLFAVRDDNPPAAPKGEYFVLKFRSVYDKAGLRVETVVVKMDGGKPEVSGYFIK